MVIVEAEVAIFQILVVGQNESLHFFVKFLILVEDSETSFGVHLSQRMLVIWIKGIDRESTRSNARIINRGSNTTGAHTHLITEPMCKPGHSLRLSVNSS